MTPSAQPTIAQPGLPRMQLALRPWLWRGAGLAGAALFVGAVLVRAGVHPAAASVLDVAALTAAACAVTARARGTSTLAARAELACTAQALADARAELQALRAKAARAEARHAALAAAAERMAAGDIGDDDVDVRGETGGDRLAASLASLAEALRGFVGSVEGAALFVAAAEEDVAETTGEIAQGAGAQAGATSRASTAMARLHEQAHEIAEASSRLFAHTGRLRRAGEELGLDMGELTAFLRKTRDSFAQTLVAAGALRSTVAEITAALTALVTSQASLTDAAESAARHAGDVERTARARGDELRALVGDIGAGSQEIGRIVAVLDDLVDQLELVALNAAIVAAQSGEPKFAVVAGEVKRLAGYATARTGEIASVLGDLAARTERADALTGVVVGELVGHAATAQEEAEDMRTAARAQRGLVDAVAAGAQVVARHAEGLDRAARAHADGVERSFAAMGRAGDSADALARAADELGGLCATMNAAAEAQRSAAALAAPALRQGETLAEENRAAAARLTDAVARLSDARKRLVEGVRGFSPV